MGSYVERMNHLFSMGWQHIRSPSGHLRWYHDNYNKVFNSVAEVEQFLKEMSDA